MSSTPNLGLKTRSSSENEGNFIDYRLEISGTNPDSNMMIIDKVVGEHLSDTDNPHSVDKIDVGLGNVDNTSDVDKPVSTAQQAAINNAVSSKQDKTDSLTTEEVLSDDDSIPFYDVSATSHRKTLWSNVKAKLKIYFDGLYAAVVHKHTRSQITDFPSSMPPTAHSHTATDLPNASTSAKGVVQLSTATNSTSTSLAATPSAVKAAYDLATTHEAGKLQDGGDPHDLRIFWDRGILHPRCPHFVGDLNDIDATSVYNFSGSTNTPEGYTNWGFVESFFHVYTNRYGIQVARIMDAPWDCWVRRKDNGIWGPWKKMLSTEDEGSQYCGIDPNNAGKIKPERASAKNVYSVGGDSLTLSLVHSGCMLRINNTAAITVTVPTNVSVAFPIDTEIEIMAWSDATITIAGASGVDIKCGDNTPILKGQTNSACLKKVSTDIWSLQGELG